MVYLKPRQDLTILAPPLPVATMLACTVLISFCQKRSHKKVLKHLVCLEGSMQPYERLFPSFPFDSLLICDYPASRIVIQLQTVMAQFRSSLHPEEHRPESEAISLVSMILSHLTCFTLYTNPAGSL